MSTNCVQSIVVTWTIRKWCIVIIDAKSGFLQTDPAQSDVYLIPPYASRYRNVLLLLENAEYGLINSNAKWQHRSDAGFVKLVLQNVILNPELFTPFSEKLKY